MPIYTRAGDKGYTSILGGISLPKDEDIFEANSVELAKMLAKEVLSHAGAG